MSAYSDWKCGAITEDEYNDYCAWEDRRDRTLEEEKYLEDPEEDDDDD